MENLPENQRKGWKFWLAFWLLAAIFLFSWFVFLQIKYHKIENLKPIAEILPLKNQQKNELEVLADIYQKMGGYDSEKTFLVLFQNNLELRPGGGFIGSFGIMKIKNGKLSDLQVHDTGIFDSRVPNSETPPAPLADILGIKSWKMRDSNWSPDFATDAKEAERFYKLGQGQENFDGIISLNSNVLNSFLAIGGPVRIDGYPGEFNDQSGILSLEYQVEKGFEEQGIEKGARKDIMKDLAIVLEAKARNFSLVQQLELARKIEEHLVKKDIQLFFKDQDLQKDIENINWGGRVQKSDGDYLMVVDANLNSLKSDFCIKRKIDYNVDLSGDAPTAILNITYEHTCRAKDWMTTDYRDWLRVYAPAGSSLDEATGQNGDAQPAEELGKKVFGMKVFVPVGQTKTVTLKYKLPDLARNNPYKLLVQKQSGSGELPFSVSLRKTDKSEASAEETLTGDRNFSF